MGATVMARDGRLDLKQQGYAKTCDLEVRRETKSAAKSLSTVTTNYILLRCDTLKHDSFSASRDLLSILNHHYRYQGLITLTVRVSRRDSSVQNETTSTSPCVASGEQYCSRLSFFPSCVAAPIIGSLFRPQCSRYTHFRSNIHLPTAQRNYRQHKCRCYK